MDGSNNESNLDPISPDSSLCKCLQTHEGPCSVDTETLREFHEDERPRDSGEMTFALAEVSSSYDFINEFDEAAFEPSPQAVLGFVVVEIDN